METSSSQGGHWVSPNMSSHKVMDTIEIDRIEGHNKGWQPKLRPDDLILLAVLGVVHEAPARVSDIVAAVKYLGGADWQPTTDVIAARIHQVLSDRFLIPVIDSDFRNTSEQWLGLSPKGMDKFRHLMCCKTSVNHNFLTRTFLTMKICFLDILGQSDRDQLLQDIREYYIDARAALAYRCAECPRHHTCLRRKMENEIDLIQWEATRLDQLVESRT